MNSILKAEYLIIFLAALLVPGACSSSDEPAYLEPVIRLAQATDITRTGATVSATVEYRGEGRIGSFRFRYGSTEAMEMQIPVASAGGTDAVSATLSGLKPGTLYFYCAEGENPGSHTVVRSVTGQFSTMPNERPAISGVKALSSGPVGLIVGFDITDDGGEPLVCAGCDVVETASGAKVRHLLPADRLNEDLQQMYVNGLTAGREYVITPFAANSVGESEAESITFTAKTSINLVEPGVLATLIGGDVPPDGLVISGQMNGSDFSFLRKLLGAPVPAGESAPAGLATGVNLSDAVIVGGGSAYDGFRYTENNVVGTGMFAGCASLRRLVLPATAVRINRNAFADCTALESITVPAAVRELLPSDGCVSLTEIAVQEANIVYRSFDGVLFDAAGKDMLWFPQAKKGSFTMPPAVVEIGENALRATMLTSIGLPAELTTIGRGAFSASALGSLSIPPLVRNIPEGMAQDCRALTTVRLGRNVELIGDVAFGGCPLADVYVEAQEPPVLGEGVFDPGVADGCVLHVPASAVAKYRNHAKWNNFKKIIAE